VAPLLSAATVPGSPQWKIQYFFDSDEGTFVINDLRFFSPQRGVAVGYLDKGNGKSSPMSVITGDGGANWKEVKLKDIGVTLFSVNENVGWMVSDEAIWKTSDSGENWEKLKKLKGINRVWFLDESHGFAVGAPKLVYETKDGGKDWAKVEAAEKVESNPHYTSYDWITFATPEVGIIVGGSVPPRKGDEPAWFDPEAAASRRETPTLLITLETRDGGQSWKSQTAPTLGQTTRVRMLPTGFGLALIQFAHAFEWPSEVFRIEPNGKSERVYRQKDRVVTDCAILSPQHAVLAAIDPPGRLYQLPVPGKLHILQSNGLTQWTDMPVDYKANGRRATLSVVDADHMWVATDTGMILTLTK
jgi:photosystem II stability/assembly factor-like uncharacterized protein